MKKFFAVLGCFGLVCTLSIGLAGCTNTKTPPKKDTPAADSAKKDTPAADAGKKDTPAADAPKKDEPKKDEPKKDEKK